MVKKIQKKEMNKKFIEILIFLIKFNLLSIPMYLIIFLNISFPQFQIFLANLITVLLKAFGYDVVRKGFDISILHSGEINQIEISWDCTGWKSLYALFALSLATPVEFYKKIKFLAFAIPSMFIINFLRIVSTILFSLSYGFNYFEILHNFFWQFMMIALIPIFWLIWINDIYFKKYNLFYRVCQKQAINPRQNSKGHFSKPKKG